MTLDPSSLPPSYMTAVNSTASNHRVPVNGHGGMRVPLSNANGNSAFALMGAHQQHQLLQQARMATNLHSHLQAVAAAAVGAASPSIMPICSTSPGSTNSSPDEKNSSTSSNSGGETPMSRTNQYKKIMKPLLERKRRARINKCLDELKDIMTVALQAQGENVSKLEKADILELTVRHLHKLQSSHRLMLNPRHPLEEVQRFQAGYSSCAQEAASFLLSSPGVDVRVSQRLLSHLSSNLNNPVMAAAAATGAAPGGFHSPPPPVSSGCVQTKVEPPPRPSSNPVGGSTTLAHFTVAIAKAGSVGAGGGISGTEEDDDEEDLRMGGHALLKPEAIRLNPGDKNMWRPF